MQSVQNHARAQRRARLLRRMGRCWQLYLLLLPAVVYIFIFNYMPLYGIQVAFRNYSPRKGYWGSPWVGLKYFNRFFSSPDCWNLIRNTLSLSVYSLLVGFPLPILL
ncbi:MAG: sugar ABC transporter permease, partial [Aristaeellaceae bacterium]